MNKDTNNTFPGTMRDHKEAVEDEAEKVSTKIDEAFLKLANKMRDRAEKAKAKMGKTKNHEKRAILLRRFELYADAAAHLEERLSERDDI